MLMERRPDVYVPSAPWREFLRRAFAENRPYDVLVRQILAADGADPATRPAAASSCSTARPTRTSLTRDVGRLFLGSGPPVLPVPRPSPDRRLQAGALLRPLRLPRAGRSLIGGKEADGTIKPGSVAVLGEKAEGDVTFSSVFKKKVTHRTGPRVLDGPARRPSRPSAKGQEYLIPPDKDGKVRPVPVVQPPGPAGAEPGRRPESPAVRPQHRQPALGPDDGPGPRPPGRPAPRREPAVAPRAARPAGAREFVAMKYDIKAFLRELALTRAYQRSQRAAARLQPRAGRAPALRRGGPAADSRPSRWPGA